MPTAVAMAIAVGIGVAFCSSHLLVAAHDEDFADPPHDADLDSDGSAGSSTGPDGPAVPEGVLRTDRTLVVSSGEGDADVWDQAFVYNHTASRAGCGDGADSHLAVGCWPLGRLMLYPEDHHNAAQLLAAGETEQLQDSVGNQVPKMDTGLDGTGEHAGGGGDGKILPKELSHYVYSVLRTWQYEEDRIWLDRSDSNADGLIDVMEASLDGGTENPSERNASTTSSRTRFNFADKNRDGWLSETDVSPFRNPIWFSRMHQWTLGAMVLEVSTDSDPNVSRAEYLADEQPSRPFTWEVRVPRYVKEREFDRLDVDGTGTLDFGEASRFGEIRLASMITHAVSAIFHACDADADGTLEQNEVVAQAADFAKAPGLPARHWDLDSDGGSDAYGDNGGDSDSDGRLEHREL